MSKVLVWVAWPYANGTIHLGHMAGSILPPDIFSRYNRLLGNEVMMVGGSDQHGTPITVSAEKEGVTPEEIANRYHEINKKAIEDMGIEYSLFTKTHTDNHFETVQDVFLTLLKNGYPSVPSFSPTGMLRVSVPSAVHRRSAETSATHAERPSRPVT